MIRFYLGIMMLWVYSLHYPAVALLRYVDEAGYFEPSVALNSCSTSHPASP